ncbi:hypothetical protein [Streptomyces sp. NPDC049887]|uniref:hypothetical protein n=1 Tax=Streptomyces sp. NPDC049887 TaxID=3155654 RepID=UPI00343AEBAE
MDRETLHNVLDAAIDAVTCDEGDACKRMFIEMLGIHMMNAVGEHNARDLSHKARSGLMPLPMSYDRLSETMRPVYAAAGRAVNDQDNDMIRTAFLKRAGRKMN